MNKPLQELIAERGFDRYQSEIESRFRTYNLEYSLSYGLPTSKPGMRLDFENLLYMGSVTVWVSGECEMEAFNIMTGEVDFYEHHEFVDEAEFFKIYPRVPIFMRDALG